MKKPLIIFFAFIASFFNAQNCPIYSTTNYTYSNPSPYAIVSNDFNNDGKKDLVAALSSYFMVYLQTSANSFNTYTVPGGGLQLFSEDLNNDGHKDILSNTTFLGTGTGSFTSMTNNLAGLTLGNALYDFDNDGKLDIIGSAYYPPAMNIYFCKGNGNGTFSTSLTFTSNAYGEGIIGCNLNNDNNKDLVLFTSTSFTSTIIKLFSGNGNGSFTSMGTYTYSFELAKNPSPSVMNYNESIKVADFDNDGNEDIIAAFNNANQFAIIKGNGNFTFNSPIYSTVNYFPFAVTDLNNDGFKDIIAAQPNLGPAYFIQSAFNNGNNNLISQNTFSASFGGGVWGSKLLIDDFNNDLKKDIAVCTYSGNITSVNFFFANGGCVWPGDANNDGIANNLDVLELGLHINATGSSRNIASNAWLPFSSSPWTGTITSGGNLNNADCNGDGTINNSDTLAIFNNYGSLHNLKEFAINSVTPQISIVPDQPAVFKGTWGTSSIFLGDAANSITNINGIAFTLKYDQTLIQTDSVWVEYPPSFINSNNLHFRKKVFTNGVIYSATTHTTNLNVNGNGKIAVLHYKIKSSLQTDSVFNISLANGYKISATGSITPLTTGAGALLATVNPVNSIHKNSALNSDVIIYPNPSNGLITLVKSGISTNDLLTIYNTLGQLVFSRELIKEKETFDLKLEKGIYHYTIGNNENNMITKKMIIN